jgi:hypothetical protein
MKMMKPAMKGKMMGKVMPKANATKPAKVVTTKVSKTTMKPSKKMY